MILLTEHLQEHTRLQRFRQSFGGQFQEHLAGELQRIFSFCVMFALSLLEKPCRNT